VTGGKVKSSKTRSVVNRAANAFRMAAQTLCRSNSALLSLLPSYAFPAWVHPRLSPLLPIKSARIFYRLWTSGDAYAAPGIDAQEQQYQQRMLKHLKKKALALGLELIPISTPNECVS